MANTKIVFQRIPRPGNQQAIDVRDARRHIDHRIHALHSQFFTAQLGVAGGAINNRVAIAHVIPVAVGARIQLQKKVPCAAALAHRFEGDGLAIRAGEQQIGRGGRRATLSDRAMNRAQPQTTLQYND